MATQTDVQQLIQSLTPTAVNNGNPNTIYNAPPMMDAQGNWFAANLPSTASINALRLPSLAPLPTATGGGTGGPAFPIMRDPGPWTPPSTWTPPTQPPGTTTPPGGGGGSGGGGGTGTGGNTPPSGPGGNGALNTRVPQGPTGTLGGRNERPLSFEGVDINNPFFNRGGGSIGGTGGNPYGASGLWGTNPWLAQQLGLDGDGSMDWQQLLDIITEPFISGDMYNPNTGTWNWGNAAGGVLGGLPALINQYLPNMFNPNLVQENLSSDLNRLQSDMLNKIGQGSQENMDQLIKDVIAKFGGTTPTGPSFRTNELGQRIGPGGQGWLSPTSRAGIRGGATVIQSTDRNADGTLASNFGNSALQHNHRDQSMPAYRWAWQ